VSERLVHLLEDARREQEELAEEYVRVVRERYRASRDNIAFRALLERALPLLSPELKREAALLLDLGVDGGTR
jgi:hypothetical protein